MIKLHLPTSPPPGFPPLCVRCLAPDPKDAWTIHVESDDAPNQALGAVGLPGLSLQSFAVPACSGCKTRMRLRHWGVLIGVSVWGLFSGLALFGTILVLDLDLDQATAGVIWFAGILGAMLLPKFAFPPWVSIEIPAGQAHVRLRQRAFADALAELNGVQPPKS